MVVVLFLVVIAAIGAGVYLSWRAKEKRRLALASWAMQRGLQFSPKDPYGIDRYDFELFEKGDGRGCENVMSGTFEGMRVEAADYWYYDETSDSEGRRSRTYHRFNVVVATVDAWVPKLCLGKESFFSRIADHVGFRDIEFESEEFNRRFNVTCGDREFAFKLLDARMLRWLLETAGDHAYEVNGNQVLAYTKRVAPDRVAEVFYAAKGFINQIPRLVWADYGKAAS